MRFPLSGGQVSRQSLRLESGLRVVLCAALVCSPVLPPSRLAADPTDEFDAAYELWAERELEQSLMALETLLKHDEISDVLLRDAYLLKGQCHIGLAQAEEVSAAEEAFCMAVVIESKPEATLSRIRLAEEELQYFERARAMCEDKGPGWKLLAAGGAAASAILYLLLRGADPGGDEEGPEDLPDPPPPPQR